MNSNISIVPFTIEEHKDCVVNYYSYTTYYGETLIASTEKGICYIGFGDKDARLEMMLRHYPWIAVEERKSDLHNVALRWIDNDESERLTLHISGTTFQMSVWSALLEISLGKLSTYKLIADIIGRPKAVRAVGTAIGQNPISYIIPCHRIIRSDGGLGGYSSGLEYKKKMLEKEGALSN